MAGNNGGENMGFNGEGRHGGGMRGGGHPGGRMGGMGGNHQDSPVQQSQGAEHFSFGSGSIQNPIELK